MIHTELDQVGVCQLELLNHGVQLQSNVESKVPLRHMAYEGRPTVQLPIPDNWWSNAMQILLLLGVRK